MELLQVLVLISQSRQSFILRTFNHKPNSNPIHFSITHPFSSFVSQSPHFLWSDYYFALIDELVKAVRRCGDLRYRKYQDQNTGTRAGILNFRNFFCLLLVAHNIILIEPVKKRCA